VFAAADARMPHEKCPARFPPGLSAQLFQIALFDMSHGSNQRIFSAPKDIS
jgi:hypothetical protein